MIAILLATYNGGKFLAQQLDSILQQTHEDWHLYLADDDSSDNTWEIVETYCRKYPDRITAYKNPVAAGSARNNFFQLATSRDYAAEYIMFCDQDDVWLPEKIQQTLAAMQTAEKRTGRTIPHLVHTNLEVVDEALNELHPSFFQFSDLPLYTAFAPFLVQNNVTGCTAMINRKACELLRKVPPEAVNQIIMHDYWLGLLCAALGEITIVKTPLMRYRQHQANQVGAKDMQGLKGFYLKNKNPQTMRRNLATHYRQARCFQQIYNQELTGTAAAYNLQQFLKIFETPLWKFWQRLPLIFGQGFFAQKTVKRLIKQVCYLLFAKKPD